MIEDTFFIFGPGGTWKRQLDSLLSNDVVHIDILNPEGDFNNIEELKDLTSKNCMNRGIMFDGRVDHYLFYRVDNYYIC